MVVSSAIAMVIQWPKLQREGLHGLGFTSVGQVVGVVAALAIIAFVALGLLFADARRLRLDGSRLLVESIFRRSALQRDAVNLSVVAERGTDAMGSAAFVVTDGVTTTRVGEAWSYARRGVCRARAAASGKRTREAALIDEAPPHAVSAFVAVSFRSRAMRNSGNITLTATTSERTM